jgi:hypothetical protein
MVDIESNPMPTEVNVGSMVDVTVGEYELPEEDSAPGFYVDAKLYKCSNIFLAYAKAVCL